MATTSAQVQQLYVAYLGRAADKAGLDYWLDELNATPATLTLENLRANFVTEQAEYSDAYAGLSRQDTVIKIYNNLFGRAPDAAGLTYWTTGGGSTVNADQLLSAFVNGAASADAKVLANKVLVAEVYTSAAGENYTKADATSSIAGVNGDAGSVGDALDNLETLPGLAIPAGLAAVKAEAIADKAVIDLKSAQVTPLSDLNKAVIALNDKLPAAQQLDDADLAIVGTGTGTPAAVTYDDAVVAVANATAVRDAVSGSTTVTLQANATNATNAYTSARDTFTKATVGNVDLVNTYEKAVAANAAVTGADETAVTAAEAKVQVDFSAANTGTKLADANTAAGLTGAAAVTDTASLYEALTDGTKTAAQIKTVSDAFGTFLGTAGASDYTTLKGLASTDYTKAVAQEAEDDATDAIEAVSGSTAYLNAFTAKATADTNLANATAADALVSQAEALTAAHTAAEEAADAVTIPAFVHDLTDSVTAADGADLFYFADGVKGTDDFTLTAFNKGDALYIGEGYTLATGVTLGTDGVFVGTNAAVKEVFFTQAANGTVSVNIESNAVGHAVGGSDANVAVITLAGVTSLSDVSYANGVITSAHVA